jgi:hypothetical protein
MDFIMKTAKFRKLLLTMAVTLPLAVMLLSCSKKDEAAEAGLLKYIPADSPYVLVTQGQLPDDLYDKLEPEMNKMLAAYQQVLEAIANGAMAEVEAKDGDVESVRKATAVIDELGNLLSIDGLAAAGIDRRSRMAVFGQGLLPVFRLTLSDGNLLEAEFAKLETRAAESLSAAMIDGHSYRYVAADDWRIILAIIGNELVVSAVPESFDDAQLKTVLGLSLPDRSLADTTRLRDIAKKYQFDEFMIGMIDVERIAAIFLDEPSGINAALLAIGDYSPTPLDEVCKSEIRATAGIMPRVVTGYTHLSTKRIDSKAVVELREDIAGGVATLTGAVPGLGQDSGGLFSYGMSFDLLALREFYTQRLDALEADPYECELFADVQGGVAQGREILNQPVPPIAYGFKGFLAQVENLEGMDLANGVPPTSIDMRMLIATDNAEGLLAMGAMFSPEIANLGLQAGGDPVLLDIPQVQAMGQIVYVAMSDDALAISTGEGMQDGLSAMLEAKTTNPSPFVSIDMDAARYYDFMRQAMVADADGELAEMPELKQALENLMEAPADLFSRFRFDVRFTEHGVELQSNATLQD